jgi:anti-sigma B factor antagonist
MEPLEPEESKVAIERSNDAGGDPVVTVTGELDIGNADSLRSVVEEVVAASPRVLVFDLGDLTFMDSSGIAVLVSAANHVETVEVRNPTAIVRRIIESTGLAEILRMDPP